MHFFLQIYRATPNRNVPNGSSTSELFVGRKLRIDLDALKFNTIADIQEYNTAMECQFNKRNSAKMRSYNIDYPVFVKLYKLKETFWSSDRIRTKLGRVKYESIISRDSDTPPQRNSHLK